MTNVKKRDLRLFVARIMLHMMLKLFSRQYIIARSCDRDFGGYIQHIHIHIHKQYSNKNM